MAEIQSLARGLKILDKLATAEDGVGITELAQYLDVDKSSASRLVQTLVNYGYAEQNDSSRKYQLGAQVIMLCRDYLNRIPLRDQARPFLQQLVDLTGEAAHLGVVTHGQAVIIDDVESPAMLRVDSGVGRFMLLHCTAIGKCLLAYHDLPLPDELEHRTERTIVDKQRLEQHLAEVRQQGYAFDDEENFDGVRCLAVPVYGYKGTLVGTIGISGPSIRMTLDRIPELVETLKDVADSFSAYLGYDTRKLKA